MDWNELNVYVNNQSAEAVANILNEAGASGVVVENLDESLPGDKIEKDSLNLVEDIREVSAYFSRDNSFKKKLTMIKKKIAELEDYGLDFSGAEYEVNLVEEENWATSWHEYFTPTPIGNSFLICPSWIEPPETERTLIEIDPGQAFGVGTHESTQLAVFFLEKYISKYSSNSHMLDVGIGTGILSIVSAKMGLKYIVGVDISEAAIRTARENIKINKVNDQISLKERDMKDGLEGKYSIITANLLPDILSDLLPDLVNYIYCDGIMILSGIIDDKEDEITNLIEEQGLKVIDRSQADEWISLVVQKG